MNKSIIVASIMACMMINFLEAAPAITLQASLEKKVTKEKNSYGDTDAVQSQKLNISVRSLSTKPVEFTVQWLFIAKSAQNGKLWTYSYDGVTLNLKNGQGTNFVATADKLVAKSYDMYFGTHSKTYSYAVVAFEGTNVIKCVSNIQAIQAKCSKWSGFEEMLNAQPPEDK